MPDSTPIAAPRRYLFSSAHRFREETAFSSRKRLIAEVGKHIKKWKLRWAVAFAGLQIVPVLELLTVGGIYLLLDPEKGAEAIGKVGLSSFAASHLNLFILFATLASFGVFVFLKYVNQMNLIRLQNTLYLEEAREVINRYLLLPTKAAKKITKERITSDIITDSAATGILTKYFFDLAGAGLMILFYTVGIFYLSWKLALIVTAFTILPLAASGRFYKKLESAGRMKVRSQETIIQFISELINGFTRSKMDGLEDALENESKKILKFSHRWRLDKVKGKAQLDLIMEAASFLLLIGIIYVGLALFSVPLTTLTILFVGFNRMRGSFKQITDTYALIKTFIPPAGRHIALLDDLTLTEKTGSSVMLGNSVRLSQIEMKGVSFDYEGEEVLKDIHFTASAGDRILIQGPSGQGKTTFLEILCGLLSPKAGRVFYNEAPLTEVLFYEYRDAVAYVSNSVYLFDLSLKDNLVIGNPPGSANEEEIRMALTLSGLDRVIKDLPQGLNTRVGPDGCNLSLGERQRVILARIYLRRPSLLILDEATSNLDLHLEDEVMENMLQFINPETILVIVAHRKPRSIHFNKQFHMIDGRIYVDSPLSTS